MSNQPITDTTLAPWLKWGRTTVAEAVELWCMGASWDSVYENGCNDVDDINCHVQCCCDDAFADAPADLYDSVVNELAKQIEDRIWDNQQSTNS